MANSALLIIDMQKGSFEPLTIRYDSLNVVNRINALSDIFRERNCPVIFIQHDGTGQGSFVKGQKDWQILDELIVKPSDIKIDKYVNDSFYKSKLDHFLKTNNINNLVITGCATDFCIESTIQSALVKNYNLICVSDAHTTAHRPHLKAKQIIDHYNWVWQDLMPTQGKIQVTSTQELLSSDQLI